MPLYTKDSLDSLRQKINLVEVLESHVELKRAGASYKALCPFHDEKSPSFVVQNGDSHYHCFGCGAHGDAIAFLMTHQRLSFTESVESLAERFHVTLEAVDKEEKAGPNKGALKTAMKEAAAFFHMMLLHTEEGHKAMEYLLDRGVDLSFIKKFHLGLAPKRSHVLRRVLHGKFISDEVMAEAGLLVERDGSYRDFFSDRITIPIKDSVGNVIGFSARKYNPETFGGKYVNSAETPLFKKSRVLFGLNYCRRRIAKEKKALIVEGQLDALKLIEVGFNITVAGQGTAFGPTHAKEIIDLGVGLVFLAFDPDSAGQEAAVKVGHLFQKEGIEVIVIQLPASDDPDSFLRKNGAEAFLKLMDDGLDYMSFLINHHSRFVNMQSPAGKSQLVMNIASQVRTWSQPLMVYESLRKLASLLQIPEDVVGLSSPPKSSNYLKPAENIGGAFTVDQNRLVEGEVLRWLLLMAVSCPELLVIAKNNLSQSDFFSPPCKKLYLALLEISLEGKWDMFSLNCYVGDEEVQRLIQDLLVKKVNRELAVENLKTAILELLKRNWNEKMGLLNTEILNGVYSEEEACCRLNELILQQPSKLRDE